MDMTGSERIPASREVVYEALNNPEILKQSMPGCQELNKVSDTGFDAVVVIKVGPIKATFKMAGTLSDLDPPNGYTISGEGKGGVAGFAKGSAKVHLEQDGDATILTYEVHADVGGKFAQLGARMINSTAMKFAGDFFVNFNRAVTGEQGVPAE
ncbi:MAG: carbon monoxide dehydrogenase subunit family protein [Herminiimonas sp.]|jgi:carbon monoxide dehydrogenase subunit G|nr:carbon monoxide dehydrogenase subunit family protein [Herminiimonas sp.]